MFNDLCLRKGHLDLPFSLDPGCQMYLVTEGTALEQKGGPMSKPASHLRGQQIRSVDPDMSENLFLGLSPQKSQGPRLLLF